MSNMPNESYFHWYNRSEKLRMRYPSETAIGFLIHNVKPGSRVLDLGCGSGRHVLLAAELGYEAHGLDLSPEGLEYCAKVSQQRGLSVHLKKGTMDATGYEGRLFDAVICYSAINANTLADQRVIIAEVARILKSDGMLLVNFYGEKDGVALRCRAAGKNVSERTYILPGSVFHEGVAGEIPDYLLHVSTPGEIRDLLSPFREVKQFEIYLPYGNAIFTEDAEPSHLLYAMARSVR